MVSSNVGLKSWITHPIRIVGLAITLGFYLHPTCAQSAGHLFFRVELGSSFAKPVSGRLLVFVTAGSGAKVIDDDILKPEGIYVAAREIEELNPGSSVEIDTDDHAFPYGFSSLKPGDYQAQAVLDVGHTYGYSGREAGDIVSSVTPLAAFAPGQSREPLLVLNAVVPNRPTPKFPPGFDHAAHLEEPVSPVLSDYFGRAVRLRAWVIEPPGYREQVGLRYPTVYWTHGFGQGLEWAREFGAFVFERMMQGKMPPMIWVMLDESCPTGTHEFADSVNEGPWGKALTTEFIPALERKYRMDGRTRGRFLQGHSSGGWATLQLQINYPRIFGGTWSTSPDPMDFHDFVGVNLYADHANVYRRSDGTSYPLVRDHARVLATLEQCVRNEDVLGDYGGQMASFDWVFSPRGPDGKPLPMFNRDTGEVDPTVVGYWRDHYDLAHIVASTWVNRGPLLRGKIHVFVGTADTFYLDGTARRFETVLRSLDADAHFTYIPNRTHFDLYSTRSEYHGEQTDPGGLLDQIASEMYRLARPAERRGRDTAKPATPTKSVTH